MLGRRTAIVLRKTKIITQKRCKKTTFLLE
jgi:hypothetical protein